MNDRELLELAAKAIGYDLYINKADAPQIFKDGEYVRFWNPLNDDGDALRLAVKLDILNIADMLDVLVIKEGYQHDKYSATRRAIVRAAAEIGKAMEG